MAMVDVDEEIYKDAKEIVENNRVDYPTIQNYINKAIRAKNWRENKKQER